MQKSGCHRPMSRSHFLDDIWLRILKCKVIEVPRSSEFPKCLSTHPGPEPGFLQHYSKAINVMFLVLDL